MQDRIWVTIHPRREWTRVLVTDGPEQTLLKARLAPTPWHQRALPTLLEALALWHSRPVHAVLAADAQDGTFVTNLCPIWPPSTCGRRCTRSRWSRPAALRADVIGSMVLAISVTCAS